jgi:hypothetical protein
MRKKTFFVFVAYVWTKTLLGLTFKPFHEIREVVRRPVLLPVIFTPFVGLLGLFLAGRMAAYIVRLYGLHRELMAIFLGGVLFSIVLWQMLLVYLLISFLTAIWKNKTD